MFMEFLLILRVSARSLATVPGGFPRLSRFPVMVVMVPTAATIGIRTSEKINRLKEIFINKANDFAFRSEASLRPNMSVSNAIRGK